MNYLSAVLCDGDKSPASDAPQGSWGAVRGAGTPLYPRLQESGRALGASAVFSSQSMLRRKAFDLSRSAYRLGNAL
jgi:hypothetical protein